MRPIETPYVTLPDGLMAKIWISVPKAGHASITIVTCQKQEGYDCIDPDSPFGSLSAGRCTRSDDSKRRWNVRLCKRAADFRDCEESTTRTLRELADVLAVRLREQGAWWQ